MSTKDDILGLVGTISREESRSRYLDKKRIIKESSDSESDFRSIEAEATIIDAFSKLALQIRNLKFLLNNPPLYGSPMNLEPSEQAEHRMKEMLEMKTKMDILRSKLRALIKEKMEFLADITDDILGSGDEEEKEEDEDEQE